VISRSILRFLGTYSPRPFEVDRLIVSAYVRTNAIKVSRNLLIKGYLVQQSETKVGNALDAFIQLLYDSNQELSIETLVELFEFVVSPVDKEVNGAVYTPQHIRQAIVTDVIARVEAQGKHTGECTFTDIACGCGSFFATIALHLRSTFGRSFYQIYRENIYGLDIQRFSIDRCRILLTLLALEHGEDRHEFDFNLFVGDALRFDWHNECRAIREANGVDVVVGNPPYVGTVKLPKPTRELIKKWEVARSGKVDLYMPFFQIGIELLQAGGVLGFISVNSFIKSLNGRGLRGYLSKHGYDLSIVDFDGDQVFKGRTTYTCLCTITRTRTDQVHYIRHNAEDLQMLPRDRATLYYSALNDREGWTLGDPHVNAIIAQIEAAGEPLGKRVQIKNGIATLRNDLFVFKPVRADRRYYYLDRNETEYAIERALCRNIVKPNTLKSEDELDEHVEKLIFPYHIKSSVSKSGKPKSEAHLISPTELSKKYPRAQAYLKSCRSELSKRDKGEGNYEQWYAFGRSQGLTIHGAKLLFPYIADAPSFVFSAQEDLLYYNGFAIVSDDADYLQVLKKVLMSRLFRFYLSQVSRPYDHGYYSLGKRYIERFGVLEFSESQRRKLLQLQRQVSIDDFVEECYGIHLDSVDDIA